MLILEEEVEMFGTRLY